MYGTENSLAKATSRTNVDDLSRVSEVEVPILACILRGDTDAATTICRQVYAELLGRYCMAALGDVALANQAALDTWNRLAQALKEADSSRTIRSILLGVARRRCAYMLETKHAPLGAIAAGSGLARDSTIPLTQRARVLLSRMRPTDRETLILRYICMLTYGEIGSLWGIGECEARARVSQALTSATRLLESEAARHG